MFQSYFNLYSIKILEVYWSNNLPSRLIWGKTYSKAFLLYNFNTAECQYLGPQDGVTPHNCRRNTLLTYHFIQQYCHLKKNKKK